MSIREDQKPNNRKVDFQLENRTSLQIKRRIIIAPNRQTKGHEHGTNHYHSRDTNPIQQLADHGRVKLV